LVQVPVNRQALALLPALHGADLAAQVSGDLFPGIEAVGALDRLNGLARPRFCLLHAAIISKAMHLRQSEQASARRVTLPRRGP
jgi:hypothetical protein